MCVATLNVATQPCAHRWYQLHRPCKSSTNLANCRARLQLEGWETRTETCPWCDSDSSLDDSTHRLFGSPLPASPVAEIDNKTRIRRSGSGATMDSLSRVNSIASVLSECDDRAERDRGMNERLDVYISSLPHEVLPSAKKNYPTYPSASASSSSTEDTIPSAIDLPLVTRTSSGLSRKWRRSLRFSMDLLRS